MKDGMPQSQSELENVRNEHAKRTTGDAVKSAISEALSRSGAKRLPDATDYNPEAAGASVDGMFKSRGEFFQKVWEAGSGRGLDPRLIETRNLGENFRGVACYLVPEEIRPDLMQIPCLTTVISP